MSDWKETKLCSAMGTIYGITVDNTERIYFTAGENIYDVKQNDTKPRILVHIKGAGFYGIVWNGTNILYICDYWNHTILSYSTETGNISTLAGQKKDGGHKDGKCNEALFCHPQGIALWNNNLYTTDWHSVRKIDLAEGIVSTVAGSDKCGCTDGEAKSASFYHPFGISVDEDTIYVADSYNHCIRKIKDGIVSTLAGSLHKGHQDGPLALSQFCYPKALIMDVDGNLLVGDQNGLRRVHLKLDRTSTPLLQVQIASFAKSARIFAGGKQCIMKLTNSWQWKRWVWIGHLKEDPTDCLLATPKRHNCRDFSLHSVLTLHNKCTSQRRT